MNNFSPVNVNKNDKIIDLERYNGRINLSEPPSTDVIFQMQEKNALQSFIRNEKCASGGKELSTIAEKNSLIVGQESKGVL